jgi:hypothetical protein
MRAVMRMNTEQASKVRSWEPTRHNNGEGRRSCGFERPGRKNPTGVVVTARMGEVRWATREVPADAWRHRATAIP